MPFIRTLNPKQSRLTGAALCLVVIFASVSACSSAPGQSPQQENTRAGSSAAASMVIGDEAMDAIKQLLAEPQDVAITPEEARALPYAASYVHLQDQARALLILGQADVLGLSAPRLQWFSNGGEVLETLNGRVVGIHGLTDDRFGVIGSRPATLACFRQAAVTNLGIDECVSAGENSTWQFDMRMYTPYHSVYKPHSGFKRYQAQLSYRVTDRAFALAMPNGDTLTTLRIEETGHTGRSEGQPDFTNEFYIDRSSGRVSMSKQWLGQALGYITIQDVQPFAGGGQAPNSPFRYIDPQAAAHASYPKDVLTVKVKTKANKLLQAHFAGEPRMSQIMATLPADGAGWFYGPLTRLHSAKLDQEFAARRAGMRLRLLMLAQTYRADGEQALAEAATMLLNEFDSWPLRGTYIHGFSLAEARINLAQNHKLNFADGRVNPTSPAWYEIQLNESPAGAMKVGLPNHALSDKALVYAVDMQGIITRVPMAEHNSNNELRAIAAQPGARVLYSLPDDKLPKGFRDLNYQLALFLQHWDFSK